MWTVWIFTYRKAIYILTYLNQNELFWAQRKQKKTYFSLIKAKILEFRHEIMNLIRKSCYDFTFLRGWNHSSTVLLLQWIRYSYFSWFYWQQAILALCSTDKSLVLALLKKIKQKQVRMKYLLPPAVNSWTTLKNRISIKNYPKTV